MIRVNSRGLARELEKEQVDLSTFANLNIFLNVLMVRPTLIERIKAAQYSDEDLCAIKKRAEGGWQREFVIHNDGSLWYGKRLCIPKDEVIRAELLSDAHSSSFSIHPGGTKMYQDLKRNFWWRNMKREIAEFVSRCLVRQMVKAEQRKPPGLLQPLPIPEWKWQHINKDFILGLPRSQRGHDAIWVIVDRLTKSAHFIPVNASATGDQLADIYIRDRCSGDDHFRQG